MGCQACGMSGAVAGRAGASHCPPACSTASLHTGFLPSSHRHPHTSPLVLLSWPLLHRELTHTQPPGATSGLRAKAAGQGQGSLTHSSSRTGFQKLPRGAPAMSVLPFRVTSRDFGAGAGLGTHYMTVYVCPFFVCNSREPETGRLPCPRPSDGPACRKHVVNVA